MDVNANGTRMVSCSKSQEIIYWDLNLKAEKSILTMFEEEHENVIDIVVFAPFKTAKTITKTRLEQDNDDDSQIGGTDEENKAKESQDNGEKDNTKSKSYQLKGQEIKKMKEKLAKLKKDVGTKTNDDKEEEKKEEEDDIEVKDEFVASGSRDKKIKLWIAKKGI